MDINNLPEERVVPVVSTECVLDVIPVQVVEVYQQVAEGLHIALDACTERGYPLNDPQRILLTQCLYFSLRDLEKGLRDSMEFSINMFREYNGHPEMTIHPRQMMEDLFSENDAE